MKMVWEKANPYGYKTQQHSWRSVSGDPPMSWCLLCGALRRGTKSGKRYSVPLMASTATCNKVRGD